MTGFACGTPIEIVKPSAFFGLIRNCGFAHDILYDEAGVWQTLFCWRGEAEDFVCFRRNGISFCSDEQREKQFKLYEASDVIAKFFGFYKDPIKGLVEEGTSIKISKP